MSSFCQFTGSPVLSRRGAHCQQLWDEIMVSHRRITGRINRVRSQLAHTPCLWVYCHLDSDSPGGSSFFIVVIYCVSLRTPAPLPHVTASSFPFKMKFCLLVLLCMSVSEHEHGVSMWCCQYACAHGYIWRLEAEVGWIVSITLSIFIWKQSFNLKLLALASLVGQWDSRLSLSPPHSNWEPA